MPSARRVSRYRSSDLGAVDLRGAGVADQHVSQTVVLDMRARAASGERLARSRKQPEALHHHGPDRRVADAPVRPRRQRRNSPPYRTRFKATTAARNPPARAPTGNASLDPRHQKRGCIGM